MVTWRKGAFARRPESGNSRVAPGPADKAVDQQLDPVALPSFGTTVARTSTSPESEMMAPRRDGDLELVLWGAQREGAERRHGQDGGGGMRRSVRTVEVSTFTLKT